MKSLNMGQPVMFLPDLKKEQENRSGTYQVAYILPLPWKSARNLSLYF